MNPDARVRILPATPYGLPGPPGRFGVDDCYPPAVWLPILGPASYLAWRHLARQLARRPDGVSTSLTELAADLGLGSPRGQQSAVGRTIRRLERFGILRRIHDELFVIREHLPYASPAQLGQLHPSVRARHDLLRSNPAIRDC